MYCPPLIGLKHRNYPREEGTRIKEVLISGKEAILPMGTMIIIIGGILGGIFTPTEASVIASLYAMFLALIVYREVKIRDLPKLFWNTLRHTIRVMFIISAAGLFSWLMIHQRIPQQVIAGLTAISSNEFIVLGMIIIILLILGCFLDIFAAIILTVPIVFPVVLALGFDPIWFGVIMVRVMEIGLVTPPFGLNIFILASVTDVPIGTMYRGIVPFVIADFAHVALLVAVPSLSLFLPQTM